MQELWGHGGFHPDYKGKPVRPGFAEAWSPHRDPLRRLCMMPGEYSQRCNGDPKKLEMPGKYNICNGRFQAASEVS
jgi:hypothetical protein